MIKLILISALTVTVEGCRFNCSTTVPTKSLLCASEKDGAVTCHLLSQCHLNAENCNRRMLNRPLLNRVRLGLCCNIRKPNSSGPCAKIVRPTAPTNCRDLKCLDTSTTTSCYRSKRSNCRLLTNCQMQRLNCVRGNLNRVAWADPRQCAGLTAGRVVKCKAIPQ